MATKGGKRGGRPVNVPKAGVRPGTRYCSGGRKRSCGGRVKR